jgi:GNAT superfamily N-acetyltransferase
MRRILLACAASLIIYIAAFAWLLDRPLTLGALRSRIEANIDLGQTIRQPKLLILAGSNGSFSHRCETIEPIIHRPCINAGVAVGIGLDYLFTRWKPLLHPGDIVYLPLEEAQYVRPRATVEVGPDATIMLRHDRATLWMLSLRRQVAALFAADLRAAIMSLLETALAEDGFHDPRQDAGGGYNAWGDHVGHTAALAAVNQSTLAMIVPVHPDAAHIRTGYGTLLVTDFLRWAAEHGVSAIGGLPTGFIDSPIDENSLDAIRAIYRTQRAGFLELPNHSRYPRSAFFDTQDHLNEAAQIDHSVAIGQALIRPAVATKPARPIQAAAGPQLTDATIMDPKPAPPP